MERPVPRLARIVLCLGRRTEAVVFLRVRTETMSDKADTLRLMVDLTLRTESQRLRRFYKFVW